MQMIILSVFPLDKNCMVIISDNMFIVRSAVVSDFSVKLLVHVLH